MERSKNKIAVVFPGGGCQYVGMGLPYYNAHREAREVFHKIDDSISFKLSKIMFSGTTAELNLPENLIPAIFTTSMAIAAVVEKQSGLKLRDVATIVAGHCIGEYAALCAIGCLDIVETAIFLRKKGKIIQSHVPKKCSMAAIFTDIVSVKKIIASVDLSGMFCKITNDNSSNQVVICGHSEAVSLVLKEAKKNGTRGVSLGAFNGLHSSLMKDALFPIKQEIQSIGIKPFSACWIPNCTAKPVVALDHKRLVKKVRIFLSANTTRSIRWREILNYMVEEKVLHQVECGSGRVLTNIGMREGVFSEAVALDKPEQMDVLLDIINGKTPLLHSIVSKRIAQNHIKPLLS